MPARTIIALPILYFFVIFQGSFLPHFAVFGMTPNLIFIFVIFLIFFLPAWSTVSAFWGGFFLDIFSGNFLGFNILILLGAAIFIRLILKRYVQIPVR